MKPRIALLLALGGLAAITGLGALGYVLVEGMAWNEALYMTVITISTVGYGEVRPLSPAGRMFTIGLIITAAGMGVYLLSLMAQTLVELSLHELFARNAMQKKIDALRDHVILCGYGRLGRIVAEELLRNGMPMVVIESNPARDAELAKLGVPYLIGSAAAEELLEAAGLARAKQIVIATGSDPDNVFITLSAREGNPNIIIHARGESDSAMRRLRLAGAHQVVSAYQMGGVRMATSVLRPAVVDFLEISRPRVGEEIDLEEILVSADCELCGTTIRAIEKQMARLRIVALKRGQDRIQIVPDEETEVCGGDHLVAIGGRGGLDELARRASPR